MGRFTSLVITLEVSQAFKAKYNIPTGVEIKHYHLGEWYTKRPTNVVVIPIIAIIKGGMKIPMGRVTRDFLILYRLSPTQCFPNLFRILGSVDMLNCKMGVNLTHHDVNWVYSCQNGIDTRYYIRTRVLAVRLISCLPETNKGMDEDQLIISGDRQNGLHYPTQDGVPSAVIIGPKKPFTLSLQKIPSLTSSLLCIYLFFVIFFVPINFLCKYLTFNFFFLNYLQIKISPLKILIL